MKVHYYSEHNHYLVELHQNNGGILVYGVGEVAAYCLPGINIDHCWVGRLQRDKTFIVVDSKPHTGKTVFAAIVTVEGCDPWRVHPTERDLPALEAKLKKLQEADPEGTYGFSESWCNLRVRRAERMILRVDE